MTFVRYLHYAILPAIFCGFLAEALAEETAQAEMKTAQSVREKKQTIDFEDELVEGSAQKPEFFYLFQKKNFNYKRLIRLRENIIPEMKKSAEDIQRLRGGR